MSIRGRKPHKLYSYRGQCFTIEQLAAIAGVRPGTLYSRINTFGYSIEEAVHPRRPNLRGIHGKQYECAGRTLTLREWSAVVDVPVTLLRQRLAKGWTIAQALSAPTPAQRRAGVVSNFPSALGTGAGSFAQEKPKIGISE